MSTSTPGCMVAPAVLLGALAMVGCGEGGGPPLLSRGNVGVDAVFAEYDRPDSPGCALGVIQDGEFVYRAGYGMANLEHAVEIGPDTVFRTGSVGKQFTAMTVLLLEEAGELSLDDDVRKWLPEVPDFGDTITIAQLLHHTSGLRDYLTLMDLAGYRDDDYYDAPELLQVIARQRNLNFPPGDQFLYSNTGYFLLGQIVERVTGSPLSEVARRRIFEPLGMTNTHYHDDITRVVPGRASGYAPARGGAGFVISMTTLPIVGDGGVFTTVNDLLAWDRNFYDNRLGKGGPALIARWLEEGLLNDGTSAGYSAGIVDDTYRGLRVVSHGGAFVGFRAEMMRFPDQRLGILTLCNLATANPTELSRRVADIYLGDEMEPRPEPAERESAEEVGDTADAFGLAVAQLREYEGRYTSPELQASYEVQIDGGRLSWSVRGRPASVITPSTDDRFEDDRGLVFRFARNSRGEVSGFLLDAGRVENLWFEKVD